MTLAKVPLGWFLTIFWLALGFAIVTAVMTSVIREPSANMAIRLGALLALSAVTLFSAWAGYRDLAIGRTALKLLAIVAIMGCVPILLSVSTRFHAPLHGSALAVAAFGAATLWLSRRRLNA